MSDQPSPRRWFRFSLRALFVLVTIACVLTGWGAYHLNQIRQRHAAIARLERLWAETASEVTTARISMRQILRGPVNAAIGREQVERVLERVDLFNRPEDWRILSDEFALGIPADAPAWGEVHLYIEPGGLRQSHWYDGRSFHELIRDASGEVVEVDASNKQVRIHSPGKSRNKEYTTEELRPTMARYDLSRAEFVSRDGNEVTLKIGSATVEADLETGFILRRTLDHGAYVEDLRFLHPTRYPGEVIFPAAIIETRYHNGELKTIQVEVTEDAQFNAPPPENALVFRAEAGMKIFDERNGRTKFVQLDYPLDDVRHAFPARRR